MSTKIHGSQIQIATIPPEAIIGGVGGGGGGGSSFNGIVDTIGFQVISDEIVSTGTKSTHYIGNSGFIHGWSCYSNASGTVQISVNRLSGTGTINMIGTGIVPGLTNAIFASGNNFTGWNSTGVVLGDRIILGVSNISGQIQDLTFNLLIRNI